MAAEPAPSDLSEYAPGALIAGRYRLLRQLGSGGMGVVWVAHCSALDVAVAVKMISKDLAGGGVAERLAREAHAAAQLGHPALVRVIDFGATERGDPFLVMELLTGEDLHALLQREQRLPGERAAALLLPIMDGLATAHAKGIVHRDVKPENIFVARDGRGRIQPKVLDFGIAKLTGGTAPSRLTGTGAVVGSPEYLSPEQAKGLADIDFRTDIWSLGVVLYELTTGVLPFAASNYNALIQRICQDAPVPTTELAAGDAQLWTIIDRCLRKQRDERWGSMWELGEALALWLFERGVRVDAASRSLKHGWLEGRTTGVQILVSSAPPEAPTLRPEGDAAAVPEQDDGKAARRRKRATIAVAACVGALGVALVVLLPDRAMKQGDAARSQQAPSAGIPKPPPPLATHPSLARIVDVDTLPAEGSEASTARVSKAKRGSAPPRVKATAATPSNGAVLAPRPARPAPPSASKPNFGF